ncbi:MAG: hypothetical protein EA351_11955 [Gemmatimonadales bacterium]|nr:MAG: hypothetical protein EA351_11955 [Gemmatimonadales bacterium]
MAQQTRSKLSLPLALLAVVAMGGLFYALFIFSEPTQVTVAEEAGDQPAVSLGLTAFQDQADNLREDEQRVQLDGLIVSAVTSPSLFWFNLADESPFLVRLELELMEAGVSVEVGDVLNLTGRVHEVSDQLLDQWMAVGVLPDEGARGMAATADHYLLADDVQIRVPDELQDEADAVADPDGADSQD